MEKNKEIKVVDNAELKKSVRESFDFWKEANNFSKTILPKNIDELFISYCKKNNFSHNEKMFFRIMLAQAIEFNFTMAMLKDDVSKEEEDEKL
jgi:hypothetical protein